MFYFFSHYIQIQLWEVELANMTDPSDSIITINQNSATSLELDDMYVRA